MYPRIFWFWKYWWCPPNNTLVLAAGRFSGRCLCVATATPIKTSGPWGGREHLDLDFRVNDRFRLFSCGLVRRADGGGKKTTGSAFSATIILWAKNASFAQMNAHASRRRQPFVGVGNTLSLSFCTTAYTVFVPSPKPFHTTRAPCRMSGCQYWSIVLRTLLKISATLHRAEERGHDEMLWPLGKVNQGPKCTKAY